MLENAWRSPNVFLFKNGTKCLATTKNFLDGKSKCLVAARHFLDEFLKTLGSCQTIFGLKILQNT
jgi:hypothetical protein